MSGLSSKDCSLKIRLNTIIHKVAYFYKIHPKYHLELFYEQIFKIYIIYRILMLTIL